MITLKRTIKFASLAVSVHAADTVNYTLPAIKPEAPNTGPAGWVSNLYQFSLMGAGLLAFGVIVYAGFMYALRAGNPSAQSDARDRITQALLGLLLLLGAYIILRTINPALVNLPTEFGLTRLQTPTTQPTTLPGGVPAPGGGNTSGTTDTQARDFLKDKGITVNSPEPKTSLKGVHQDVLDEAVSIKQQCGCTVQINAGTEKDSHDDEKSQFNHVNGYKIDIDRNASLDNYLTKNFKFQGIRSDGARLYLAPSGAIYAQEESHWDVLVL